MNNFTRASTFFKPFFFKALGDLLEVEWAKEQVKSRDGKGRASLGGALLRCFGRRYAFLGLFTLLEECAFRIAQPLFMGETTCHIAPLRYIFIIDKLNLYGVLKGFNIVCPHLFILYVRKQVG